LGLVNELPLKEKLTTDGHG